MDRTEYWDTLSVSQSDGAACPVMRQPGHKSGRREGKGMDIRIGNTIKAYSTEEILEEIKQRGSTTTIVIDQPGTNYYISVPALNKDIKGCINGLTKEKVVITITAIK